MCQSSEYSRIPLCICVSMQLLKGSEYSRIPSMTGFCICKRCTQDSEYACIWMNMVVELEHFDEHFVKTKNKESPQENILMFFLLDTLKTTFWVENLTQWWTQSVPLLPQSGHFFLFSKRAGDTSPLLPSCTPVSVAESEPMSWICQNILENPWINCSDYAMGMNMHERLICSTDFWRCLRF